MTELEPHLIAIIINRIFAPPEQRNEQAAQQAVDALKAPLKVLDEHLKGRDYLLGKDFTVADLNVASVLSIATFVGLDLSATPKAQSWFQKCAGREASQRTRAMK